MIDPPQDYAVLLLMLGGVTIASLVVRRELARLHIPSMVAFIMIGVALSYANSLADFITPSLQQNIDFLAKVGVVVLLFRVGLESDLGLLVAQLGNAAIIWLPNMLLAGAAVFMVILVWPGYGLLPALFAGVAASATSISVSAAVWEEAGRLGTPEGALLLDVAELDDISAVILLSMLFAVAPLFKDVPDERVWTAAVSAACLQYLKLVVFCAGCYFFSRQLEEPLTAWFAKLDNRLGPILFAAGAAFVIAAIAETIGFSIAIGALFAGLAFSRDPAEARIDRSFAVLPAIFGPFFFVAIGLAVDVTALNQAIGIGTVLLLAAALGKFLGAGLPAALITSPRGGAVIGLSMIPRAEIFLIVMLYGLTLGEWAVPENLFTAAVFVSLATCIFAPIAVQRLLSAKYGIKESS